MRLFFILSIASVFITGIQSNAQKNPSSEPFIAASTDSAGMIYFNKARSISQICGEEWFTSASELQWDQELAKAAADHANDLIRNSIRGHVGSDGSRVRDRVNKYTRDFGSLGEIISYGRNETCGSVPVFLRSKGHCRLLMNPKFSHLGIATIPSQSGKRGMVIVKLGRKYGSPPIQEGAFMEFDELKNKKITLYHDGWNCHARNLGIDFSNYGMDHEVFITSTRPNEFKRRTEQWGYKTEEVPPFIVEIDGILYTGDFFNIQELIDHIKSTGQKQ